MSFLSVLLHIFTHCFFQLQLKELYSINNAVLKEEFLMFKLCMHTHVSTGYSPMHYISVQLGKPSDVMLSVQQLFYIYNFAFATSWANKV